MSQHSRWGGGPRHLDEYRDAQSALANETSLYTRAVLVIAGGFEHSRQHTGDGHTISLQATCRVLGVLADAVSANGGGKIMFTTPLSEQALTEVEVEDVAMALQDGATPLAIASNSDGVAKDVARGLSTKRRRAVAVARGAILTAARTVASQDPDLASRDLQDDFVGLVSGAGAHPNAKIGMQVVIDDGGDRVHVALSDVARSLADGLAQHESRQTL